jgi:ubiquinone/menaquinone biosynthesis C-methylase UbiE
VNVVIASASEIPVPSETASMIVSTETFEHIPEIGKTLQEIHRIAVPGAILICSIPNNYCNKYIKKGPHPGHINNWTYDGFVSLMQSYHFELVKGYMKGKWIPLPLWLTKTSYQFPLSSESEYYNTNFFYVFRVNK